MAILATDEMFERCLKIMTRPNERNMLRFFLELAVNPDLSSESQKPRFDNLLSLSRYNKSHKKIV